MMPFHRQRNLSGSAICVSIAMITLVAQSALVIAAEPVNDTITAEASRSRVMPERPTHGFTARNKYRSATSHEWSRSVARPEPVWATPSTDLSVEPKIRFISASGSEEGEMSTAVASDAASSGQSVQTESESSAPTSSLSVKEQLLNALRAQREATVGTAHSSPPGSLTILHSPVAPSQATTAQSPVAPIQTPVETSVADHSESHVPTPQPNVAKSRIGLTRTLEDDLNSADPYVRVRAQRYLRLEMQLLKLRASQAAAAEHPSPNAGQPTLESAAPHEPERSSVLTPSAHPADHHEHRDDHPANDSSPDAGTQDAHAAEYGHHVEEGTDKNIPQHDAPERSPHASLIDSIVVDGPIDRLGLANNLFAVGQYPLALEMYQQAAGATLTPNQHFWVEYQTANCLRRLGNPAEASNRYRNLANHPEAGWLSQQANWWVETLEKIRLLEKTLSDHTVNHHRAAIEEVEQATPQASSGSPATGVNANTAATESATTQHSQNSPALADPAKSSDKESNHDEHIP